MTELESRHLINQQITAMILLKHNTSCEVDFSKYQTLTENRIDVYICAKYTSSTDFSDYIVFFFVLSLWPSVIIWVHENENANTDTYTQEKTSKSSKTTTHRFWTCSVLSSFFPMIRVVKPRFLCSVFETKNEIFFDSLLRIRTVGIRDFILSGSCHIQWNCSHFYTLIFLRANDNRCRNLGNPVQHLSSQRLVHIYTDISKHISILIEWTQANVVKKLYEWIMEKETFLILIIIF